MDYSGAASGALLCNFGYLVIWLVFVVCGPGRKYQFDRYPICILFGCRFRLLMNWVLLYTNFSLLTWFALNCLNFVYYIVKYYIFVTVIARHGARNVLFLNFCYQNNNQNQSFMKKLNKKGRKVVINVLIAVSSFVAGIVSVKNPAAGELIEEVTTIIATGLVQVPADTIPATF